MSPETLAVVGFALLLAGWFAMFFRIRQDQPGHPLANYGTYIGARVGGFRLVGKSGFSLLSFYWKHYGADARFFLSVAGGVVLVAAFILIWSG